jgi:hypothetical protein
MGDSSGDGPIDVTDLRDLASNYGATFSDSASAVAAAPAIALAVPQPS